MREIITSPEKFVTWLNLVVPGAYRTITTQDARDMTECGLIGRYGYYGRSDLEMVRAILQYELLREKRRQKPPMEQALLEPQQCKGCGKPLPTQPEAKKGRPKEYCASCESFRSRERYRKWRDRRKSKQKCLTETQVVYN